MYRPFLVREIGGFLTGFDGSQDYELALRVIAKTSPGRVRHVPHILYQWRAIRGSTAFYPGGVDFASAFPPRAKKPWPEDAS